MRTYSNISGFPIKLGMTEGRQKRILGLSNKVFASKYKLALPTEKELRAKLLEGSRW